MEIRKNGEVIAEPILPLNSDCVHVDANGDTKIECFSVGSDTFEIILADSEVMQLRMTLHQRDRKRVNSQRDQSSYFADDLPLIATEQFYLGKVWPRVLPDYTHITYKVSPVGNQDLPEFTPDWSNLQYDHVRQDRNGSVFNYETAPEYDEEFQYCSLLGGEVDFLGYFKPPADAKLAAWDRPGK